jgi:hypothetical protein
MVGIEGIAMEPLLTGVIPGRRASVEAGIHVSDRGHGFLARAYRRVPE